jgi:DNA-binding beta-propeller fold protein YncE
MDDLRPRTKPTAKLGAQAKQLPHLAPWDLGLLIWAVLRLPMLGLVLLVLKEPVLALVETLGGFEAVVNRTIFLRSTLELRLLCFGGLVLVLGAIASGVSMLMPGLEAHPSRLRSSQVFPGKRALKLGPWLWAPFLQGGLSAGVLWGVFQWLPVRNPGGFALGLATVLAVNAVPTSLWVQAVMRWREWATIGFGMAAGLAELGLPKPFLLWVLTLYHGKAVTVGPVQQRLLTLLPVLPVAAIAALMLNSTPLVALGQAWHGVNADPPTVQRPVQRVASGDFNGLALNQAQHRLYVSGHGLPAIVAYDTRDLRRPSQVSAVDTSSAQGFAYSPRHNELYVYDEDVHALQVLDAQTLALRRSISNLNVAPGDAWIAWDAVSDRILIASEADDPGGHPFVVVDRATGQVMQTLDLNTGNIFLHPQRPWLYLSSFRRSQELLRYDTQTGAIAAQVNSDPRVHRMAWDGQANELLLASSVRSTVLRYDAQTLQFKGSIPTVFSVRSVAVDPQRHWLLTAGLATNMLEVIDLNTYQKIAEYYVGPWLREICLDPQRGVAYVSANGALYQVQYVRP